MKYDQFPPEIGGFIYNPEAMKRVYDAIVSDSGVDFTFHTSLIDLRKEGGRVTHAVCAAKSGLFAVEAAIFIDATGDGDLAAMAGAPFEFGDEENLAQAATLCSLWSGIDWSRKEIWKDGAALDQAFRDGVFSVPDPGLPGILHTVADSLARRVVEQMPRWHPALRDGLPVRWQVSVVVPVGSTSQAETFKR